jgi:hypothetical protein
MFKLSLRKRLRGSTGWSVQGIIYPTIWVVGTRDYIKFTEDSVEGEDIEDDDSETDRRGMFIFTCPCIYTCILMYIIQKTYVLMYVLGGRYKGLYI